MSNSSLLSFTRRETFSLSEHIQIVLPVKEILGESYFFLYLFFFVFFFNDLIVFFHFVLLLLL